MQNFVIIRLLKQIMTRLKTEQTSEWFTKNEKHAF